MTATQAATDARRLPQGDLRLLETDLARQLLSSSIPARLAFVAPDGTPRVVPTWFEWNGTEIVMAAYVAGPNAGIRHTATRLAALRANPSVALTIDTDQFPPQSLTVRGRAEITEVDGLGVPGMSAKVVSSAVPPSGIESGDRARGPENGNFIGFGPRWDRDPVSRWLPELRRLPVRPRRGIAHRSGRQRSSGSPWAGSARPAAYPVLTGHCHDASGGRRWAGVRQDGSGLCRC
ncbi:pyridoxamine 5'-phosphate oxidase family protein [Acidiferrimicrobium sp. IK]|uniref:pyridoxamine 5'-phosphate oxidase family protein n=1 Tax=Acidiferrimicrobium sp. IK TaxID=2871700 RepID=UPI003967C01D|nr:pyridoxamine 5'-phosphate oxidase family protein [Acidiferrimicrobium sp. IK]